MVTDSSPAISSSLGIPHFYGVSKNVSFSLCLIIICLRIVLLIFRSSLFTAPHRISFTCISPSWVSVIFGQYFLRFSFPEIPFCLFSNLSFCYNIFNSTYFPKFSLIYIIILFSFSIRYNYNISDLWMSWSNVCLFCSHSWCHLFWFSFCIAISY